MEKKPQITVATSHSMPQPRTPEEWESYRRRCEEAKPKVVEILPDGTEIIRVVSFS